MDEYVDRSSEKMILLMFFSIQVLRFMVFYDDEIRGVVGEAGITHSPVLYFIAVGLFVVGLHWCQNSTKRLVVHLISLALLVLVDIKYALDEEYLRDFILTLGFSLYYLLMVVLIIMIFINQKNRGREVILKNISRIYQKVEQNEHISNKSVVFHGRIFLLCLLSTVIIYTALLRYENIRYNSGLLIENYIKLYICCVAISFLYSRLAWKICRKVTKDYN